MGKPMATDISNSKRNKAPFVPPKGRGVTLRITGETHNEEGYLFAGDLLRMFTRWADSREYIYNIVGEIDWGNLGGVKSVLLWIDTVTPDALATEVGAWRHRCASPFSIDGRIVCSMAWVSIVGYDVPAFHGPIREVSTLPQWHIIDKRANVVHVEEYLQRILDGYIEPLLKGIESNGEESSP